MKPKLILDLDGTLIDDSLRHWTVFTELTGVAMSKDEYWRYRRSGLSNKALLEQLSGAAFDLELFRQRIESRRFLSLDTLMVKPEKLAAWGEVLDLVLCTVRTMKDNCLWQLDELLIRKYFTNIVIIPHTLLHDDQYKLPALLDHVSLTSHDIIMGDTEVDMLTGKCGRLRTVAVCSGIRSHEHLRSFGPDLILQNAEQFKPAFFL